MAKKAKPIAASCPDITFLCDAILGCEVVLTSGDSVVYPMHYHLESYVFGFIRKGTVRLARHDQIEEYTTGEMYVVPPLQVHSISADAPYAVIHLCLDAAMLTQPTIRRRVAGIVGSLRQLVHMGTLSKAEGATLAQATRRLVVKQHQADTRKVKDSLETLRKELADNPECHPTLASMEKVVNLCRRHFSRAFHARYGMPPRRYQKQSRLRKARKEMRSGLSSLAQTAAGAGFCDQSHFSREFKKLYGITPSQYVNACGALPSATATADTSTEPE